MRGPGVWGGNSRAGEAVLRFLPPRRGRNRKAQAGGTPLAGSALGIRSE